MERDLHLRREVESYVKKHRGEAATHCNSRQHTAKHYNTHCNISQDTATRQKLTVKRTRAVTAHEPHNCTASHSNTQQHTLQRTPQHTAALRHTSKTHKSCDCTHATQTHSDIQQHIATHTATHTTTHCNTLQRTATRQKHTVEGTRAATAYDPYETRQCLPLHCFHLSPYQYLPQ